jgi:hypothetical protein
VTKGREKLDEMEVVYHIAAQGVEAIRRNTPKGSDAMVAFAVRLQGEVMAMALNKLADLAGWGPGGGVLND